jgi:hypothetical protein
MRTKDRQEKEHRQQIEKESCTDLARPDATHQAESQTRDT